MPSVWSHMALAFALGTGVGAGLLALLSWEIFRRSAFGRALFVLCSLLSLYTIYHGILLITHASSLLTELLRSAIYTGLLLFLILVIKHQRSLYRGSEDA